ncbi:MAG: DUF819 domain-containing protein [Aureliella sp.]
MPSVPSRAIVIFIAACLSQAGPLVLGQESDLAQGQSNEMAAASDSQSDPSNPESDSLIDASQPMPDEESEAASLTPEGITIYTPGSDGEKNSATEEAKEPFFKNDAVILGILLTILGFVFWSCNSDFGPFKLFYRFVPMLLMCYFLPSLLTLFGLVDHHESNLYYVATRYLLPASLVLLTLSIDLTEVIRLGPKALIMFLTGTVGVVLGGPLAVLIVSWISPATIGVDGPTAVWRGLSTVAGSWIGGGANQAAMQVVFMTPPLDATEEMQESLGKLYSVMVAVDVLVAELWMVFLLLGIGKAKQLDSLLKADASSIERLQNKMEQFSLSVARVPSTKDLMLIGAIGFGATAVAHWGGDQISTKVDNFIASTTVEAAANADASPPQTNDQETVYSSPYSFLKDLGLASSFFWIIVLSTSVGVILSFTGLRNLEGAGASKMGTVFIFILVAVIGMGMDLRAIVEFPGYFLVGGIWMLFHVLLMVFVAWSIRAPYFFIAVGSKANIGGAASAPVVAAAFHPSLAPVGVLLAVLGYALGTYGAMLCAWLMQFATPGA